LDCTDALSSCVIEISGTFYMYYSATNSGDYQVGLASAPSQVGPWTKTGSPVLPGAIKGQPENPEVFYHSVLGKWVMLTNQVDLGLGYTNRNRAFFSSDPFNWSAATFIDFQRSSPDDGSVAIGLPKTFRNAGAGNASVIDSQGNLPILYDSDPNPLTPPYHIGRSLFYATLEPSSGALTPTPVTPSYSSVFSDNFSTETPGDLGGQNGWIDDSGANPKPQVTAGHVLDMQNTVGPSVVLRPGTYHGDVSVACDFQLGGNSSIGVLFCYVNATSPYFFIDFNPSAPAGTWLYYFDGTNYNVLNQGGVAATNSAIVATLSGYTFTASVNGNVLISHTLQTTAQRAVVETGGKVGLRNGGGGAGGRLCTNFGLSTDANTRAVLTAPLIYSVDHTDFVVEFGVPVNSLKAGGFEFSYLLQSTVNANNGYRVFLDLIGYRPVASFVSKVVSGVAGAPLATASDALTQRSATATVVRVKVTVSGDTHTLQIDGETQLTFSDSTYTSGVAIALSAYYGNGNTSAVRKIAMRESDTVTVTGLTAGKVVTLRAPGRVPLATTTAAGSSVTLTVPHYPAAAIDIDGVQTYAPAGGFYGGASFP